MKIKSCLLASFGKFKNRKIEFSDGFNLIYGENEAGKSTVMSFLKMMFYGNGGRVNDPARNLRLKYTPWDSPLMAGTVEFSHGGRNYRMEREFRGSNTTDKITLIDTDLKVEVKIGSKGDVGSEIFGLSEPAFEKSVFVGTLGAPEKNAAAEGELNGRLSNLASTGDEDTSLELVTARIRKAKEQYMSKSGRIGLYDKGVARLSELEGELAAARLSEKNAERLEVEIAEKEAEITKISAEGNRYFSIMKKADLFKKKLNLERYIATHSEKAEAEKKLMLKNGETADKSYVESIKEARSLLINAERALEEKQAEENRIKADIDSVAENTDGLSGELLEEKKRELDRELTLLGDEADSVRNDLLTNQLSNSGRKHKGANIPLVIIGGLITFISGVFTAVLPDYISLAAFPLTYLTILGAIIGTALFILAFFIKRPDDSTDSAAVELQARLDSLLSRISEKEAELCEIGSKINSLIIEQGSRKALLEAKQAELLLKGEAVLKAKNELFERKNALSLLCEPFGSSDNVSDIIKALEESLSVVASAEIKINLAADSTNAADLEEALSRLEALSSDETLHSLTAEEVAAAKDEFKSHTEQSGRLRIMLTELRSRLKAELSSGRSAPVIEREIEELKQRLEAQKSFCNAADIALAALSDSFSQLRQSFGSLLEGKTAEIFCGITDNSCKSLDISKDFDISLTRDDAFGAKSWQFLSAGTADQAYFALRLALTALISDENDTLPIIMDDALAQYDGRRTEAAMKYLKEFSSRHQLILFTCHEDIKNIAEALNVNIINL